MDIIVGTAGHIDHGKTALVRALTGTNTDRLPEEKQRGITIDLGFAELELGDVRFGFVDVPGHERFVKNMLAGASGIDLVLLVVAADEGIMPQTREHFDICRLLQIKNGIVAITKRDMVNDEMLELVKEEVFQFLAGSFLEHAPIVAVSSRTGDGIGDVRSALAAAAASVHARTDEHIARLPIDRSFAMKGFGAVVTGTLVSGTIAEAQELELLPVAKRLRVRGVQSHGRKVAAAHSGRRTAVNLAGIDHHDVERGMLLAEPGVLTPSQMFDAEVEMLSDAAPLKSRQRVRVHLGTAEVLARVAIISGQSIDANTNGFVQLRLESPVAAISGERFILRRYSPQATVGGGSILRPTNEKFRQREADRSHAFLSKLFDSIGDPAAILRALVERSNWCGISENRVRSITGWTNEVLGRAAEDLAGSKELIDADGIYIAADAFNTLQDLVTATLVRLHEADKLAVAISIDKLRRVLRNVPAQVETAVLKTLAADNKIVVGGDGVQLAGRGSELSENERNAMEAIRRTFADAGLEVPKIDEVLMSSSGTSGVSIAVARK